MIDIEILDEDFEGIDNLQFPTDLGPNQGSIYFKREEKEMSEKPKRFCSMVNLGKGTHLG